MIITTAINIRDLYDEMVALPASTKRNLKFSVSEFTKILRKFMASEDIRVVTRRDKDVDLNQVIICGEYDAVDDELGLHSITLYANYNPAQETIRFADIEWSQLCIDLIECAGHEIIHQQQSRNRNFDIPPSIFASKSTDAEKVELQEYLANTDEIEAYGYSIATEIFLKHNPKRLNSKLVSATAICKTYVTAFGINHIVTRQLLANTLKYFNFLIK